FPGKPYINRGIGGQTSAQMVVRFRQDVIRLHPAAVVVLEGTNDIAQNTGPMTAEMSEDNWQSLAELAKANGIQMILTSITPSSHFPWRPELHPAEAIRAENAWLKDYAASHSLTYVDFFPVLANAEGGMKADLTVDGVHPNKQGYALMAPLVEVGIDQALGGK
ncbi:MAG: GDSL-type esterase/lipase family protein, partial [Edaphobacter sp.]